jgi:hypothetical protein
MLMPVNPMPRHTDSRSCNFQEAMNFMSQVDIQNKGREILLVQPSRDGQQVIHVAPSQVPGLVERLYELKAELEGDQSPAGNAKEAREDSFGPL